MAHLLQEVHVGEEPTLVSLYDTGIQGSVRLCYANKSGAVNVIDLLTGVIRFGLCFLRKLS